MGIEQKVAVITGASQGIGAALVKAYRDRNYRVVATARSVKPLSDADLLVVPGDIADRKTAASSSGACPRRTPPIWAKRRRHWHEHPQDRPAKARSQLT
jgi:NAD(P)-dependent dehydrogenase (short-subunit alcohol dehydrogenase family)